MSIMYTKLWLNLAYNNIKKGELAQNAKLSSNTMRKLKHNEAISTQSIMKICNFLQCNINDIVDVDSQ